MAPFNRNRLDPDRNRNRGTRKGWWVMWVIAALVLLFAIFGSSAWGQTATPEIVVDPVPEFDSWGEFFVFYWPSIVQTALVVIGGLVAWMLRTLVALLPDFLRNWVEGKRQRDLHSAIMSIVTTMMMEGRFPTAEEIKAQGGMLSRSVIDEIRNYANKSVSDATQHFGIELPSSFSNEIFDKLAKRMAAMVGADKAPPVVIGDDDLATALRVAVQSRK